MNIATVLADLAALPPQAQQEAADFIAFLKARHTAPIGSADARDEAAGLAFRGMWKDRDDMGDASAWVAEHRRREWTR
ncbi:hypothetical protein [Solidesulfovibrio sp.]|uniref:hypothetical protein n=1 Tax=Solidesulfovibrio sp. TaxID=2910990 RepID=UPI00261E28F4|nr:hypothetical protein [Solidesulfovibrio sp.]